MNNQQTENKIHQDAAKIKNDISALVGDSAARLGKFEENLDETITKAKESASTWIDSSVSQMGDMADETRDAISDAAKKVKQNIGHSFSQYNAKAQEVVDKVPGGFGEKAAKYPWIAISVALTVGFLLGSLLKPARRLM